MSEDARRFLADAVAQYRGLDPKNVTLGGLYQGGRSIGYFANCARVERDVDPSEYDYDCDNYTNNRNKTQIDAPNNGYQDATKNFCEYYEWNGWDWKKIKGAENLGEKTIEFAVTRTDWDVVLIQGFYYDFSDGAKANGYDGTAPSRSPGKNVPYNLKESVCSNLDYLCDYLRSLNENLDIGFYMPPIHHEKQSLWLDNDMYASIIRATQYILDNSSNVNFIVPGCTIQENAKTTYLGDLTYDDKSGCDNVSKGLRRDAIHSSYYLSREILALGIIDSVVNYLYGDDVDSPNNDEPILKIESPSCGALPIEYGEIARAAVSAALENPLEITDLSALGTKDPALVAFETAKIHAEEGGDVEECVAAVRETLSERQLADLGINYEINDGFISMSFTYGYTTSDTLLLPFNEETGGAPIPKSITVDSFNDVVDPTDGVVTLREAITIYADDGDGVVFAPSLANGTIALNGAPIAIDKTITIDATALYDEMNDVPGLALDAGGASRILRVVSGKTTLRGVEFIDGFSAESGGAIKVDGSSTLTVEDSIFHGNVAEFYGGAIAADALSTITIVNSTFYDNTACQLGGAVSVSSASLSIVNSNLYENDAKFGGALAINGSSTLTIDGGELRDNSAKRSGGAIYATGADATRSLVNVKLYGNVANSGAGVYAAGSQSVLTLRNTLVYQNTSVHEGSALEVKNGSLDVYNSTIAQNVSIGNAPVVYTYYATTSFYNSIDILNTGSNYYKKGGVANAYNILSNIRNWSNDNAVWYIYNSKKPLFTNADNGDFSLAPDSQAFDMGNDVFVNSTNDHDGKWRVMGNSVDLGAFERSVAERPSTNVDSMDDVIDPYDGRVTLREAVEVYAQNSDVIEFSPSLRGNLISINGSDVMVDASLQLDADEVAGHIDYANSGAPSIDWQYDATTRQASLEWRAIDGATRYLLQISKDGGTTWLTCANELTAPFCVVNNLYPSNSYSFKAYGYDASHERLAEVRRVVFDPMLSFDSEIETSYNVETGQATLTWLPIEGATSYSVLVSRDSGQTWIDYVNGVEGLTVSVDGLWAGREYGFRVYGETEKGRTIAYRETTFTPINLVSETEAFVVGETLSVAFRGGDSATAEISWYFVTEDGDVEIPEAASQLEYTPASDAYDIKVVATGTGTSKGANASLVFASPADRIVFMHDAQTRQATLTWLPINNASGYRLKISRDGGETWITYLRDVDDVAATAKGLYIGQSYAFRAYAVDANGASTAQYREGTFAPFSLASENGVFELGDTLAVTVKGAENANASVQWYYVADSGDVAIEGANSFEYTPTSDLYDLRVVATGVEDSLGASASLLFGRRSSKLDVVYDSATRVADLAWEPFDGVSSYKVRVSRDEGTTWIDYVNGVEGLTVSVDGLWAGQEYGFRVYGETETGRTLAYRETTFTPINLVSETEVFTVGETISVAFRGGDSATAEISWYFVTEDGDVEISEAAGQLEYTPASDAYDIKVVATGTGTSQGAVVSLVFASPADRIVFMHDAQTRQATLTWLPINNACGYRLMISRDGGETWSTYLRNVDGVVATAKGLYVGKSYVFRAYAVDENGASTAQYREGTFAPFSLATESGVFELGDTLAITVKGAENARANVQWYYVGEDGDVAIEGANSFEYTPTSELYDLRVVATGVEDSLGANASLLFGRRSSKLDVVYNSATRVADVAWEPLDGISSYRVRISRDGGQTWIDYVNGVEGLTVSVDGLWAGQEFGFRVYGETETGRTLAYRETTFTPINLESATEVFTVGETISVAFRGADSATAEINWYFVTEDGDVEIPEAAGQLEYTPASDAYDVKVVATGAGTSQGAVVSLVFAAPWEGIAFTHDAQTNQATLTWRPIDDACGYRLKISRDGGETWITYLREVDDGVATAKGLYVGNSYAFRAYAVDENGVSTDQYHEAIIAPISIACYNTFQVGDTVSINFKGAKDAEADIRWYAMTPDGDGEILAARGLLEYAPTDDLYNIKVVATGKGNSTGSNSETFVYRTADAQTFVDYNAETRVAQLSWLPLENVATYKLQLSRDGGKNWLQYAKDLTSPTTLVEGLYVSKTYVFRVVGFEESGAKLATTYEFSYSPTSSSEALLDEAFAEYFAEELFDEF